MNPSFFAASRMFPLYHLKKNKSNDYPTLELRRHMIGAFFHSYRLHWDLNQASEGHDVPDTKGRWSVVIKLIVSNDLPLIKASPVLSMWVSH